MDNALSSFMSERTRACNAQAEAMKLYDAEMLQISKEVEDEELRNKYGYIHTAHVCMCDNLISLSLQICPFKRKY